MIADIITSSRILFSLIMLTFPLPSSSFAAFYLLCGVTDVLDGFIARKRHTECEKGAMLDSVADLFFAIMYAMKVLPLLSFSTFLWIWVAIIAVTKVTGIVIASKREHRLWIEHSFGNKLTGILLFLLPLSVCLADITVGATLTCTAATVTAIHEIVNISKRNAV